MTTLLFDSGWEFFASAANLLTRYMALALGAWLALSVVFAGLLRGRKIRPDNPPVRQMVTEFAFSLRSMLIFSLVSVLIMIMERAGWLADWSISEPWTLLWAGVCLVLMVLAHDAYFYWAHRLMHDPRLFRRFHRRHHKSHNPSPFTAYSFDIGEAVINVAFVPIWVALVPTSSLVVAIFMLHQIVRNTLGHSGYELMPARHDGRPMFDWLTTTVHHDIHHAEAGYNYGFYFTWWDRWMGTEHPAYHQQFAAAVRKPLAPRPRGSQAASIAASALLALALPSAAALAVARDDGVSWLRSHAVEACIVSPRQACLSLARSADMPVHNVQPHLAQQTVHLSIEAGSVALRVRFDRRNSSPR